MELADEIADEYLTCSICLDPYKEPKQLPCLHSFCKKCLSDHIENNVPIGKTLSFTCPVCRKATKPTNKNVKHLREWADTFPDNFFILGLMETLNTRSSRSSVLQNFRKLSEASEDCTKHPHIKCDSYCTLKRIGICEKCREEEHKECDSHHLSANAAANVTDGKLKDFKVQMEKLRADVEKIREAFELNKPRELRLQKEELILKISEHFSELKSRFVKGLIQKEKLLASQLNEIIDKEKTGMSDSVDECSSLIKSFNGMVDLFDKLMTSCPINALTALYNMEEQMASYSTAVGTLQTTCKKPPIEFIPEVSAMELMMTGVKIGEIRTRDKKIHVKMNAEDEVEEDAEHKAHHEEVTGAEPELEEDFGIIDESGSSENVSVNDEVDNDQYAGASAPPLTPIDDVPYSLQGFASISLEPAKPWETNRRQSSSDAQRSSYYSPSNQTSLTSNVPPRNLQRPTNDFDVSLWRNVAFFGNLTYSERRGGLVGITAMSRNLCAVTDRFNNSIKMISIKGKIVNTLTFGNMDPWDITYDKYIKQLIVTCPNQSFIVFVADDQDNNSYYINQTVQTKPYTSISTLRRNAYVVGVCRPHGNPRVDIINGYGDVMSYIQADVQYPRSLEALSDGRVVICDWTKKEVAIVGFDGGANQVYHGVFGDVLKEPMGLTKDSSGNIYVLDHKTRKVHILNGRTGICRSVLYLEGVQDPRMICIVEASRTGQALVVLDSQNGVHSFSVDIPTGQTRV